MVIYQVSLIKQSDFSIGKELSIDLPISLNIICPDATQRNEITSLHEFYEFRIAQEVKPSELS